MKQKIVVPELAPSLNKWQRMHWGKRKKIKEQWQWLIAEQSPKKHDGSVVINYTRASTRKMDLDNAAASFKPIGDALVKAGIIEDDNPDILTELTTQWQKADSQDSQCSIIEINDVSEIKES
jgi:Holliday junction resolvase RusA-like endonuclease